LLAIAAEPAEKPDARLLALDPTRPGTLLSQYLAGPSDVNTRAKPRTLLYFESITPLTPSTVSIISFGGREEEQVRPKQQWGGRSTVLKEQIISLGNWQRGCILGNKSQRQSIAQVCGLSLCTTNQPIIS